MRGRVPSRQPTGLYVHSSPPTGIPVHDSVVRQWLRGGEMHRLKELVLEGEAASLVGEYSPDVAARAFLRVLPRILNRIEEVHTAVSEGNLERAQRAVNRERAVSIGLSKDQAGLSLLHKAVIRGHKDIQDWLLTSYPVLVHLTDRERRTALHYAGTSSDPEETWRRLTEAGADPNVTDAGGFTPAYYMHHPRRARPPQPRDPRPRPDRGLVVKPANIRIWIHDRDLGRLQKVVWEGFGNKLLTEVSSQPKVRRFLSAVPYILGSIRDVHKAAIDNDLETLQKRTADPVPKDILLSKDANGLNPLHKAAGLGNKAVVDEILSRAPEAANARDALGRTPLHYAAALKDSQLYQSLVEAGAVDHLQDKKGNTPSYYRGKPGDLESTKFLTLIPEAPRTAHIFPPNWDWRLLQSGNQRQESSEAISQDSIADISKEEATEETRPAVSEDEGVGSENAQSVEDTASPQNSEQIDMEQEDERSNHLGRTVTLSRSDLFGDDSGAVDISENDPFESDPGTETTHSENIEEVKETNGLTKEDQPDDIENNGEAVDTSDILEIDKNEDIQKPEMQGASEPEHKSEETEKDLENEETIDTKENKEEVSKFPKDPQQEELMESKVKEEEVANELEKPQVKDVNEQMEDPEEDSEKSVLPETPNELEDVKPIPLIRSNTVVLQPEIIDGLTKDDNGGPENSSPEANPGDSEQTDKHSYVGNFDENQDTAEKSDVDGNEEANFPEEDPENVDNVEENQEPGSESKSKSEKHSAKTTDMRSSGKSKKNPSGRRSLKSRALRAMELGRGHFELAEPKDDLKTGEVSNSNEINNPEDKTVVEANQGTVDQPEDNEQSGRQNENLTNSELQRDVESNSPQMKEDNISKESYDEYFPDSLEGTPDSLEEQKVGNENYTTTSRQREEIKSAENGTKTTDETDSVKSKEGNEREPSAKSQRANSSHLKDRRTEAERLVASADMEGMAEMVLAGEGEALLDLASDNPDVQLFINNVPQYMAKIERVHKASREGDLRGVQTSLDRRKFAVARDNGTSLKPTPLHVAVLFGRTSVLRYLAGRFPETMHAQDSTGRTPLHYATTLPDNGHFYSLLITLGADKAIQDNNGNTAEFYLRNKGDLTREMLLAEYQDRPVPIDMSGLNFNRYSDKVDGEDTVSARHDIDEEMLLEQMERCYRLIVHRAADSFLAHILNRDLFEELRLLYTRLDNTLLDILRPVGKDLGLGRNRILTDPNFSGIAIPDVESFAVFPKLIEPLIKELSGQSALDNPAKSDYLGQEEEKYFDIDVDPGGAIIKSCVVEIARNLSIVPFAKNLKLSDLEKVEVALSTVLTAYYKRNKDAAFIDEAGENHGSYYSIGEVVENKELYQDLKEENLLVEGCEEGNWPYGRGVFISPYGDVTAWMNVREHIHLLCATPADRRGHIGPAYKTAVDIVGLLEEKVEYARDERLGLLATDPALVGNCLRLHVTASLPHLGEDVVALRKLARSKGLLLEANPSPGIFRIRNRSCQGSTEIQTFKAFIVAISEFVETEKASMRVTVTQIPNMIKNFIRKKSSKNLLKEFNK